MGAGNCLTTACILDAFSDEVALLGGKVSDTFNDGERLFVRSILPHAQEVKKHDRLKGGVALKACGGQVWIHPYIFRLVCKNGAVAAQTIASRQISGFFEFDEEQMVGEVREAVRACGAAEVFAASVDQIRTTLEREMDLALNLLPLLGRISGEDGQRIMQQILKRFFDDNDHSRFGLMNAITSMARDTRDPETRWNLEKLGGAIPLAGLRPRPRMPSRRAARLQPAELVS